MDINSLFYFAAIGIMVYALHNMWKTYKATSTLMSKGEFTEYLTEIIHQVRTEKIDGVEYWYDLQNGVFLAQGFNLEEIIDHIKSRFPEHIFLLNDTNVGGLAAITDWKVMPFKEFEKLTIDNFKIPKNVTKKPK